ncbi:TIM barrel protein [Granulosicoccus sp. 3-233]|uniref:TIM barrel protein n=1 Tax=Granulosicoccus sp. 3-233 TaxID=3417969 RepID=UPI003D32D86A
MFRLALNHMTLAKASYTELLATASRLNGVGIEVRNDLAGDLFDGMSAAAAGQAARDAGLQILAVAEVCGFDDDKVDKLPEARELLALASECGASAISLIPRNDGRGIGAEERRRNLTAAMQGLQPLLEQHDVIGLIEPLGFTSSSVRSKAEVVAVIEALDVAHCFRLVHDTFHHHLAGGGPVFPEHTGIVHVSGVTDPGLSVDEMQDADRGLVDAHDRLGNLEQLRELIRGGYLGPVSMEAFAPQVHELQDPLSALQESLAFMRHALQAEPA